MPLHPELLVRSLAGMAAGGGRGRRRTGREVEGEKGGEVMVVTYDQFQKASGIESALVAKDVIAFMMSEGIGSDRDGVLSFTWRDRLNMALLALREGAEVERVSQELTWQDFEKLASEALREHGYSTRTNVRFTRPRMEIDAVGVDGNFAVAIDCKHWKKASPSALSRFCEKQVARATELVKRDPAIETAVPVILTLYAGHTGFMSGGVPVVPVSSRGSFMTDVRGFLHEIRTVTRRAVAPADRAHHAGQ
ncbi:MAG: hypothetical protein C4291_15350 [Candidatus Dadabacteria bacterium]